MPNSLLSHTQAQQRSDDIQAFYRELEQLEKEQVIVLEAEQKDALQAHHQQMLSGYEQRFEIDRDASAHQLSLGMRAASFLGALALAASLFFFFYRYWGLFSSTVHQAAILITASMATFAFTVWLAHRDISGYFSKLAAMVAFATFTLNIVMLGQIFNITPSDKALLLWGAYGFFLAYLCDARLLLLAGIACLMAFIAARTGTWGGMYWLSMGTRPENFLPAALVVFLIPCFVNQNRFSGFAATYRISGLLALFLPILVLSNWGNGSYLNLDRHLIEGIYQVLGFVLAALAIWLGVRKGWRDTTNTGITFFVIFLYTKIFDWWWEAMPKYLFFLALGLVALLILMVLRRLRHTALLQEKVAS